MTFAPVNKIIPLSVVDGPGNRVSIFLQGCNIRCTYCHNPETQNLCTSCGDCVATCPSSALKMVHGKVEWDKQKCTQCDKCIDVCKHNASPKVKLMSAQQVFEEVEKSIPFIRGITVSGGECTLHPQFMLELFTLCKKAGLTCLIDSNGMVDFSQYPQLLEMCDGVMLDVKAWDIDVFRKLTGADNTIVKKNLSYLAKADKLTELRIVCLEGHVDAVETILGISQAISPEIANKVLLKLIRFRSNGVKGELENSRQPNEFYMQVLAKMATIHGLNNVAIV